MPALTSLHDRVLALNPTKEDGSVRLRRDRYIVFREAIVSALRAHGPLTLEALVEAAPDHSDAGLCTRAWYVRTVKLDLEARGVIERIPHPRPHRVRLV